MPATSMLPARPSLALRCNKIHYVYPNGRQPEDDPRDTIQSLGLNPDDNDEDGKAKDGKITKAQGHVPSSAYKGPGEMDPK